MQMSESAQVPMTYGSVRAVTPVVCGWTRAGHNHQNPKQILQSPQTLPRWMKNRVFHTGASWGVLSPLCHWNDVRKRGDRQSFSYGCPHTPGSPVPRDLSSLQPVNPPIHLSPRGRSAHPGLATLERRCSLCVTDLVKLFFHRAYYTAAVILQLYNRTSVLTSNIS